MESTNQPIIFDLRWYIEFEGKVIGELCSPQYEDMFWISYQVIPYNEVAAVLLFDATLWFSCAFRFKNQKTLEYVEYAVAGGDVVSLLAVRRIMMRGLYLIKAHKEDGIFAKIWAFFGE